MQTKIMPELLAKKHLDVGLIVHNKYKKVHEIALLKSGIVAVVTRQYGPGQNTERYRPIG
jgi:hypothetical protein